MPGRRPVLAGLALAALGGAARAAGSDGADGGGSTPGDDALYGRIGKMTAVAGARDALVAILAEGTQAMPGCRAYLIAEDAGDADSIWITEIWDDQASHQASLALPEVRAAIARGRPLIAGFDVAVETRPIAAASFVAR